MADNPLLIFTYCLEYIERARNIFLWEQVFLYNKFKIIQNYYQNYQKSIMKNYKNDDDKQIKVTYFDILHEIYIKYNDTLTK